MPQRSLPLLPQLPRWLREILHHFSSIAALQLCNFGFFPLGRSPITICLLMPVRKQVQVELDSNSNSLFLNQPQPPLSISVLLSSHSQQLEIFAPYHYRRRLCLGSCFSFFLAPCIEASKSLTFIHDPPTTLPKVFMKEMARKGRDHQRLVTLGHNEFGLSG